jgi:carboxypeptidase D
MLFPRLLLVRTFLAILFAVVLGTTKARLISKKDIHARQAAAAQRFKPTFASIASTNTIVPKNITFSNPKASRTYLHPSFLNFVLTFDLWGNRILRRWKNHASS